MKGRVEHSSAATSQIDALRAFLTSVLSPPLSFYSSEITANFNEESRGFSVTLRRRSTEAITDCDPRGSQEFSHGFVIAEADFLQAIAILVECPAWTHAVFSSIAPSTSASGFEALMLEAFTVLRSSPSLSNVHIENPNLFHKCLPALVCENRRLKALRVDHDTMDFSLFAETMAQCLSRNSGLKSCTITMSPNRNLNRQSLEVLFGPFMTGANVAVKELELDFPDFVDPDVHCEDAVANLLRFNKTLEKLELRFVNCRSRPEDDAWISICGALGVNRSLKELTCFCYSRGLEELIDSFFPLRFADNKTILTLNLFVLEDQGDRFGKTIKDDLVVILNHLASMLESNTTLKHVRLSYDWGGRQWITGDDGAWINRDGVEARTRERLKLMIRRDLSSNTSLESFAVNDWKLHRVGKKWEIAHEGQPCLDQFRRRIIKDRPLLDQLFRDRRAVKGRPCRDQVSRSPVKGRPCPDQVCPRLVEEFIVKVKIHHSRGRLRGLAERLCFRS